MPEDSHFLKPTKRAAAVLVAGVLAAVGLLVAADFALRHSGASGADLIGVDSTAIASVTAAFAAGSLWFGREAVLAARATVPPLESIARQLTDLDREQRTTVEQLQAVVDTLREANAATAAMLDAVRRARRQDRASSRLQALQTMLAVVHLCEQETVRIASGFPAINAINLQAQLRAHVAAFGEKEVPHARGVAYHHAQSLSSSPPHFGDAQFELEALIEKEQEELRSVTEA
ncbi:MAG TPA: hypothetical protein VFC09_07110 [Candidatus Dormibacteraeota bacterium]|nr:hypothetical protein [Candidatus Dormibacteraeota bacterium]